LEDYVETSDDLLRTVIQPRSQDSHKGDNGVVCVVGGSRLFHGAPFFSSMSCLRSGCDLVYLAVPKLIATAVRSLSPDLIVFPVADAKLTTGAADALLKWLPEIDCLVLGPGMGRQNLDGAKKLIRDLCLERNVRATIDAEAQHVDVYNLIKRKGCVTTPHPGEFRRIFGVDAGNSLEERLASVSAKAKEFDITVVLKGAETIISDGARTYINKTGSPGMTCGGIGDTLSGVIGGLLAQAKGTDTQTLEAVAAASYVVGLAGKKAVSEKGFHIVATDIIEEIPNVLKPFDRVKVA
jgi:ADP-dependent NAD(P)H-hydrate dehydratase